MYKGKERGVFDVFGLINKILNFLTEAFVEGSVPAPEEA